LGRDADGVVEEGAGDALANLLGRVELINKVRVVRRRLDVAVNFKQ
jgi:hypothetical protein